MGVGGRRGRTKHGACTVFSFYPHPILYPMTLLRSIWIWGTIAFTFLLTFPVMLLLRLVERDPARYRTGRLFRWAGSLITYVNPLWGVTVEGGAHVDDPRHPYVVVSNHQSTIDIPLISRLPMEMKWVVKVELMKIPGFGQMMQMADDIPVDRKDPESRSSVLTRAQHVLEKRCSVMLFPEGTRSRDGRLLRYADGAFRLAIRAGVPVLPLVVEGTLDALPKNDWRFQQRAHLRLKVLPPVPTTGLTPDDAPALRQRVRDQTAAQLAAWRDVPVAAVDSQSPPKEIPNEDGAS